MHTTIDYRQQLLKEIDTLPPRTLEKIYQMVVFLKEEFIEPDEARYRITLQEFQDHIYLRNIGGHEILP